MSVPTNSPAASSQRQKITATATIGAPAEKIYMLLSDYRNGHPKILPPANFKDLVVEQGGQGAGTIIRFKAGALGAVQTMRMVITEPEPGRMLVETDAEAGIVTTFTLTPAGASETVLEIATELPAKAGLAGAITKFMNNIVMSGIYRKELALIAQYFKA